MALADVRAFFILVNFQCDETQGLMDNVVEALSNFHEDPLYRDRLSDVGNFP